jgi:MoxR-like ATPase
MTEKRPTGRQRAAAKRAPKPKPSLGSVLAAVEADLAALELAGPVDRSLAEAARALASSLDGDAGMAAAAISRELRAILAELTPKERDAGDQDSLANLLKSLARPD